MPGYRQALRSTVMIRVNFAILFTGSNGPYNRSFYYFTDNHMLCVYSTIDSSEGYQIRDFLIAPKHHWPVDLPPGMCVSGL